MPLVTCGWAEYQPAISVAELGAISKGVVALDQCQCWFGTIDDLRSDHYTGHMTRQKTATEVKAKLLALLDEVERGEEIEITRHGLTVARLTAFKGPHALEGRFAGVATSAASDDDLFSTGAPWQLS